MRSAAVAELQSEEATYFLGLGNCQDFIESLPAVVLPDCILLLVADMCVRGDEDLERVRAILPGA